MHSKQHTISYTWKCSCEDTINCVKQLRCLEVWIETNPQRTENTDIYLYLYSRVPKGIESVTKSRPMMVFVFLAGVTVSRKFTCCTVSGCDGPKSRLYRKDLTRVETGGSLDSKSHKSSLGGMEMSSQTLKLNLFTLLWYCDTKPKSGRSGQNRLRGRAEHPNSNFQNTKQVKISLHVTALKPCGSVGNTAAMAPFKGDWPTFATKYYYTTIM